MANNWHILDLTTLEKQLNTDLSEGLSTREARVRLEGEKKNEKGRKSLFVGAKKPAFTTFLAFGGSLFAILLIIMSLLTALFGRPLLGLSVLSVTVAAVVFGGILLLRAQRRLETLREYASPMVRVKRGGNLFHTDGRNLVVGDVIILGRGDLLPCDARIVQCEELVVEELIFEDGGLIKRRVEKQSEAIYDDGDSVRSPNAINMLYAGSAIASGRAVALVCETGASVYLSEYIGDGALGGKDAEPEGIKAIKPLIYKASFICASALLILSLIGLLTLREKESFVCVFTMLLSAIFLVTSELAVNGACEIFSAYLTRLSSVRKTKSGIDRSASVRNVKALDTLTGVTDLVLIGSAGLSAGLCRVGSAYTAQGVHKILDPADKSCARLLTLVHTYVKAQRDSTDEGGFRSDGLSDALYSYLRGCGFDISGASLAIKSLYFATDIKKGYGYACAETAGEMYRTALVLDEKALSDCRLLRDGNSVREIYSDDMQNVTIFRKNATQRGLKCLYVITENENGTVFEGIITLELSMDPELSGVILQLKDMGIRTTVLFTEENEETGRLLASQEFQAAFGGQIVYASEARKNGRTLAEISDSSSVFVGFGLDELSDMLIRMRRKGAKIAVLGVDNDTNELMARADIVISCDVLRYSSDKYKESVYERMLPEGKDTSVRASQQTRLLSKVIVKRVHELGGGISSVIRAFRMCRGAYVSLAQSILLFVLLMSSFLTFSAMSVLTGNLLLDPLQTVSMSVIIAFLSMTAFSDSVQKPSLITERRDYTRYPMEILKESAPAIVSRVIVAAVAAVAIRICDAVGIFGEAPSYTLSVYICLLLSGFVEVFMINVSYTKKGEGRRKCWLKVLIAYALLLGVCAVSTQKPFIDEFFPNGIGSREFLIIPAYLLLYGIAVLTVHLIAKKRKKR